jgi:anti-anti-sigma factor
MGTVGPPPIGSGEWEASVEVDLAPGTPGYDAVVTLVGEHDIESCDALREALDPLFGTVLIDLTNCRFIDSSVIAVLIRKAQELQRQRCRLELLVPHANRTMDRTIEVVAMGNLLTVHPELPRTTRFLRPRDRSFDSIRRPLRR